MVEAPFPLTIGDEINKDFHRQVVYEPWTGVWVILDGDRSKAAQLKMMMPHAYVYLVDPVTKVRTRYYQAYTVPVQTIKDGKFVTDFETNYI